MKPNFEKIKDHCLANSALSKAVFDEYLMYYAAERDNIAKEIEDNLKKYKQVIRELPESVINYFNATVIAYRVFRQEGFILKYLKRQEIQRLPADQLKFLEWQATHPWMFSFARIVEEPAPDFFEMADEINDIKYLLYSPGTRQTLQDLGGSMPRLWLNLISFNGHCFQTFGSIIALKSFTWDDLFFFASILNPSLYDESDFNKTIDRSPFPFLLLAIGSTKPILTSRGHELLTHQSVDQISSLPVEKLEFDFSTVKTKAIQRLRLKGFDEFPHYAVAYYNDKKKQLVRSASTELGFEFLTRSLIKAGLQIEPEADLVVTHSMLTTAEDIIQRKIQLNPYADLFESEQEAEEDSEELDAINRFIEIARDSYNSRIQPDIPKLAAKAGVDLETAEAVWKQMVDHLDRIINDKGN